MFLSQEEMMEIFGLTEEECWLREKKEEALIELTSLICQAKREGYTKPPSVIFQYVEMAIEQGVSADRIHEVSGYDKDLIEKMIARIGKGDLWKTKAEKLQEAHDKQIAEKAKNDRTLEIAKKALKEGIDVKAVMKITELDEETIEQLQAKE